MMTPQDNIGRSARIVVREKISGTSSQDAIDVPLRDNFPLQLEALAGFCCANTSPLGADLAVVLAAVRDADKRVKRLHSAGWARDIQLEVPVFELKKWQQATVQAALCHSLQYLTGDFWDIRFRKRTGKFQAPHQPLLELQPQGAVAFMPFSHGLDSYAQLVVLSQQDKERKLVPVNYSPRSTAPKTKWRRGAANLPTVGVTGATQAPSHAEPSGRTRPFVYDTLAAYAACLHRSSGEVIIPENGQGSLGASLVLLGAEAPHRSCHPGFTVRLSRFLRELLEQDVNFIHSALYQTKGQVLADLSRIKPDATEWLGKHPSCSYDRRLTSKDHKQLHCGFCGNCLLRRMSLQSARIDDNTTYLVPNLTEKSFEDALAGSGREKNQSAFQDVAHNAARSMQRLADVAVGAEKFRFAAEVEGLAHYQDCSTTKVEEQLRNLVNRHREEWESFLSSVGQSSWLAQYARI